MRSRSRSYWKEEGWREQCRDCEGSGSCGECKGIGTRHSAHSAGAPEPCDACYSHPRREFEIIMAKREGRPIPEGTGDCGTCKGKGSILLVRCPYCEDRPDSDPIPKCRFCEGSGLLRMVSCPVCGGSGTNVGGPNGPCYRCDTTGFMEVPFPHLDVKGTG